MNMPCIRTKTVFYYLCRFYDKTSLSADKYPVNLTSLYRYFHFLFYLVSILFLGGCMDLGLIIQLISGAVGGNVAGNVMKESSLGPVLNSVVGIIGGGIGGQVLGALGMGAATGGMDIASIVTQIAGGGIGGGVLLAIIGLVKGVLAKR